MIAKRAVWAKALHERFLRMRADGAGDAEIASALGFTPLQVKNHRRRTCGRRWTEREEKEMLKAHKRAGGGEAGRAAAVAARPTWAGVGAARARLAELLRARHWHRAGTFDPSKLDQPTPTEPEADEASRSRCRQLARDLEEVGKGNPVMIAPLCREAGLGRSYVFDLCDRNPRWFRVSPWPFEVTVTEEGARELLGKSIPPGGAT